MNADGISEMFTRMEWDFPAAGTGDIIYCILFSGLRSRQDFESVRKAMNDFESIPATVWWIIFVNLL
jgi:hypothetical protein